MAPATSDQQPTRAMAFEIELPVPPDVVWNALTNPTELSRWFPPVVTGTAGVGHAFTFSWGPGMEWTSTAIVWEPGRHLRWVDDPAAYEAAERSGGVLPLAVDWSIKGRGGQTIVRLVHSGWGASSEWDDQYDATEAGWRFFLFNLRHYLTRHRGTPRTMISARRPATIARPALWDRLLGPEGLATRDARIDTLEAGQRVALNLGSATQPLDVVECTAPRSLWGTLPGLSDALLFIEMEPGERYHCGIWLSTYGVSPSVNLEIGRAVTALADRVLGPAPAAP
jgi:uncharacterized protein YndB with AHSA1/START domain